MEMNHLEKIKGIVYLVGAGPGDPGLLTVRGAECLAGAQVVVYDYLANKRLLDLAPAQAELIYAGKIGGRHNQEQDQINLLLMEKALEGKRVVRLKGGDPFVFGRGGEECEALVAAGIPFEVVPGVTAAVGAAAYAGIPLTHRAYTASVTFITGQEGNGKHESSIDWERIAAGRGTVAFYMGISSLRHNMTMMVRHGRPAETPVALVRWGTLPEQRVLVGTLADIADRAEQEAFKPPAITIVGDVVTLRERLRWFDSRPLFGRRIMITRAAEQAGQFTALLTALGADVIECPTIRIVEPTDWGPLDRAIAGLARYDWLILTSGNAVRFFFDRLRRQGLDARALGGCRICAVGPKTAAAVAAVGLVADLVPEDYKAEGVVAALGQMDMSGRKVLFPHADLAREVIPRELEAVGAQVDAPVAYRTMEPECLPEGALEGLTSRTIDCITFTASSTVRNLARLIGEERFSELLAGTAVASIGPITSKTCREMGLDVAVEPESYTLEALADAVVAYFSGLK